MPLLVYKSSAGSGKTTTLVREYLKITLRQPSDFRHVLAITFTNKAANEMKERILETLGKLIDGTAWNSDEIKPLINDLKLDKTTLTERAKSLRTFIIHRYEEFAVSTIDAFVHRIVRTFASDVKLPQNFEVVLDKDDIVPEIISDLYQNMGTNSDLTKIMVNFVLSKIEDGKYYDPTASLSNFIKKQMDEEGFQHLRKIGEMKLPTFIKYISVLRNRRNEAKLAIRQLAQTALDLIGKASLETSDFAGGKNGIAGYFAKLADFDFGKNFPAKKTPEKTIAEGNWHGSKANAMQQQRIDGIKEQLEKRYLSLQDEIKRYTLYNLLYSKIYSLALAKEIRDLLTDFSDRTQKVHISEFNKKISDEIAGQPVPFIYERLGRKYRYFLIDEFQDTSILQWQNLLPLLEESLSYNNFNMLVGDAKQAIYRFRNGEVELFAKLPKIYNSDNSPLSRERERLLESHYREEVLDVNFRSLSEIVGFNNDFFEVIKTGFSENLLQIYKAHQQQLPANTDKTGGFVRLDLIASGAKEDFSRQRLKVIRNNIDELLAAQFRPEDICILTRTNKSAVEIAAFLLNNNIKVLTSESLLLTNSPEVRLIVAFFKILLYPREKIFLAELLSLLIETGKTAGSFNSLYVQALGKDDDGFSGLGIYFKEGCSLSQINGRPVYEVAEFAIRNLLQTEQVNIFVQYFLDYVFAAQQAGRESLEEFIGLWEEKKEKLYISMPDGGEAIKIMTVHKAKGLKFEAVIADLNYARERKTKNEYWIDMEELKLQEMDELKVGLLPLTKDLEVIGLSEVVEEENDKNQLDFLNLVYVAFTRPVQALFALADVGTKDLFAGYLKPYLEKKGIWQEGKQTYNFGFLASRRKKETQHATSNPSLEKMISTSWEGLISIAKSETVYWELLDSKPATTYGNLLHAMLAKIRFAGDVADIVAQYRNMGMIDGPESGKISSLLRKVVGHPELSAYFSNGVLVKNETELLDANGTIHRPDRVVIKDSELCIIDYKTGAKSEEHKKQVLAYVRAFEKLGYAGVNGRLVYLKEDVEVLEV
ncbi:MAG: UvrD-helicase domain-containing protein [Bacteroidales bacterium]|nr:UvrD-helicase domain-containing protein [Bacteroidales bacterium]